MSLPNFSMVDDDDAFDVKGTTNIGASSAPSTGGRRQRPTSRRRRASAGDESSTLRPLLLRRWLLDQADRGAIPGLGWMDPDRRSRLRIPWRHGSRSEWNGEADGILFRAWAEYKGRDVAAPRYKDWKRNFRCALNSLKDVRFLPTASKRSGADAYVVYEFLDEIPKKREMSDRPTLGPKTENLSTSSSNSNDSVNANVSVHSDDVVMETADAGPSDQSPAMTSSGGSFFSSFPPFQSSPAHSPGATRTMPLVIRTPTVTEPASAAAFPPSTAGPVLQLTSPVVSSSGTSASQNQRTCSVLQHSSVRYSGSSFGSHQYPPFQTSRHPVYYEPMIAAPHAEPVVNGGDGGMWNDANSNWISFNLGEFETMEGTTTTAAAAVADMGCHFVEDCWPDY